MMRSSIVFVFAVFCTVPALAIAQCVDDSGCKAPRVCQKGECVFPEAAPEKAVAQKCAQDTDCPGELVCHDSACMDSSEALALTAEKSAGGTSSAVPLPPHEAEMRSAISKPATNVLAVPDSDMADYPSDVSLVPMPEGHCRHQRDCDWPDHCKVGYCLSKLQERTIKTEAKNLLIPGWIFVGAGLAGTALSVAVGASWGSDWYWMVLFFSPGVLSCFTIGIPLVAVGNHKRDEIKAGVSPLEVRRDKLELAPVLAFSDKLGFVGAAARF
jgi:hypothetical protein